MEVRDQNSGAILNTVVLPGQFKKAQVSGDRVLVETEAAGKRNLTSYSDIFDESKSIILDAKIWSASKKGSVFLLTSSQKEDKILYVDAKLNKDPEQTWNGVKEPKLLGSTDDGSFFRTDKEILYISGKGKLTKSELKEKDSSLFSVRGNSLWFVADDKVLRIDAGSSSLKEFQIGEKAVEGILPGKKGDIIVLYKDNTAIRYNEKGETAWTYKLVQDEDNVYSILYH